MFIRFQKLPALFAIALFALAMTSCKSSKQTVTSYKYLLPDEKPLAVKKSDNKEEAIVSDWETKSPSASLNTVISEAESYLGTPYRYGGIGKNGIDCSGLTQKAYGASGLNLGRSALDQSQQGQLIKRKNLQPGDLVFFSAKNNGRIDHVGMVTQVRGEDVTFIHASSSKGVRHDKLNVGYWRNLFKLARRPTS